MTQTYLTEIINTPGELQKELYKYIIVKKFLTTEEFEKIKPFLNHQLENMIKPQLKYQIEEILKLQIDKEIQRLEQERDNFTKEYQKHQENKTKIQMRLKKSQI